MTINEAIKVQIKAAEAFEKSALEEGVSELTREGRKKVANEHRQLTEWLKELQKRRTTDVQPVKRGRWIKQEGFWNKNTVKCSLCGNYLDMNGVNGGRSDANFCPNCGAKCAND